MQAKKSTKALVIDAEEPISDCVDDFNNAFDHLNTILVGREDEIKTVKLAVLTSSHAMFIGPPGVSKSLLARLAFNAIQGDEVQNFFIQLDKYVMPDEMFGPMNTKVYREQALWEFNTTGMLPRAHFAFLDEVYRASDAVLPKMLLVLNERLFKNGVKIEKCPLITAIGTTNFESETEELHAFKDRWLLKWYVKPLASETLRQEMYQKVLNGQIKVSRNVPHITLSQLRRLQKALSKLQFEDSFLDTYDSFLTEYSAKSNVAISDRMRCFCLRLLQAEALLNGRTKVARADLLLTLRYAFGNSVQNSELFDVHAAQKINALRVREDEKLAVDELTEMSESLMKRYSDKLSSKALACLRGEALAHLNEASEKTLQNDDLRQESLRFTSILQDLVNSISAELTARENKAVPPDPINNPQSAPF
jgi:MoxR-like ATPase